MTTSIADYFSKKHCTEKFRQLVLHGAEPDDLQALLNVIMTGATLEGHTISSKHIYRSRPYKKGQLFTHVDELKYPPTSCVQVRGRLNDVGQSVFYGSNSELGTLIEARPELDQLFVISKIERKRSDQLFFIPLGMKKHDYVQDTVGIDQPPTNRVDKLVIDFLRYEMAIPASDTDCYNGSIAIANHFFRANLKRFAGSDHVGLIYPSVHGQKICDVTTYNLAMLPRTFDENFQIVEAVVYSLTHDPIDDDLVLTPLNTGAVDIDGMINWQYSHQEMRLRTEAGVFGLNVTDKYIKRVAELI